MLNSTDLNHETSELCKELRRVAAILEETEEGCVAFEAALDAQEAVDYFVEWYDTPEVKEP